MFKYLQTDLKWLNYTIIAVIIYGALMMFAKSAYKAGWKDCKVAYEINGN